jgi:hypothetical protein
VIRHIVIMKFASSCTREQHAHMLDLLQGLRPHVPEVRALAVGTSIAGDSAAPDVGLTVDVDTMDDLKAYNEHPYHVSIGRYFGGIKESATALDITLPSPP